MGWSASLRDLSLGKQVSPGSRESERGYMQNDVLVQATRGVRTVTLRISRQALEGIAGPPVA